VIDWYARKFAFPCQKWMHKVVNASGWRLNKTVAIEKNRYTRKIDACLRCNGYGYITITLINYITNKKNKK